MLIGGPAVLAEPVERVAQLEYLIRDCDEKPHDPLDQIPAWTAARLLTHLAGLPAMYPGESFPPDAGRPPAYARCRPAPWPETRDRWEAWPRLAPTLSGRTAATRLEHGVPVIGVVQYPP